MFLISFSRKLSVSAGFCWQAVKAMASILMNPKCCLIFIKVVLKKIVSNLFSKLGLLLGSYRIKLFKKRLILFVRQIFGEFSV